MNGYGQWLRASLICGLAASIIEMVFVLPAQAMLGNGPLIVFQSIAYGLLGTAAFDQGLMSGLLGVLVHVLISVVTAGFYVGAAARWPVLNARPVLFGLLCGTAAYLVMTFIVIPLSLIGFSWPKSVGLFALSFGIHLIGFGLPIAFLSRALMAPGPGPLAARGN